jgi:hypothetical protein
VIGGHEVDEHLVELVVQAAASAGYVAELSRPRDSRADQFLAGLAASLRYAIRNGLLAQVPEQQWPPVLVGNPDLDDPGWRS